MDQWITHFQMNLWPIEILLNAVIIWLVLNRIVPPSHDIILRDDPSQLDTRPVVRKHAAFPLWKCLACSLLLFTVACLAVACLGIPFPLGLPNFFVFNWLLMLFTWFFGSKIVIAAIFRLPRGHIIIFVLYTAVSLLIEKVLPYVFKLLA